MSEKALIMLENDLGVKLVIEKDPLSVKVYDLDGNEISGGENGMIVNINEYTFDKTAGEILDALAAGKVVIIKNGNDYSTLQAAYKIDDYVFRFMDSAENYAAYMCATLDDYPMED